MCNTLSLGGWSALLLFGLVGLQQFRFPSLHFCLCLPLCKCWVISSECLRASPTPTLQRFLSFFFTIFFPHPTFLNCKHIHLTYLSWKLHEAHIGVASPKAKIATYKNFTINVSPRIKHVGELSLHILNVGGKHRLFFRHLFCIEENKITNGTKGTGSPCHICFLHLENK